jgi:hypothetical protein
MNPVIPSRESRLRRRFLARLAATGAFGAGGICAFLSEALAKGDIPAIPGVNQLKGAATVNGLPAAVGTPVTARDKIATGPGSMAVVVVKGDAFLVRENTSIEFGESAGVLSRIVVGNGRLLSVFAKKPVAIKAADASIGIRGTGVYLEVSPEEVYFCLCYGEAVIEGPGMTAARVVKTTHHEEPLLITRSGGTMKAEPGPFRNHTDDELTMLEALCGREPPFKGLYPLKKY